MKELDKTYFVWGKLGITLKAAKAILHLDWDSYLFQSTEVNRFAVKMLFFQKMGQSRPLFDYFVFST